MVVVVVLVEMNWIVIEPVVVVGAMVHVAAVVQVVDDGTAAIDVVWVGGGIVDVKAGDEAVLVLEKFVYKKLG